MDKDMDLDLVVPTTVPATRANGMAPRIDGEYQHGWSTCPSCQATDNNPPGGKCLRCKAHFEGVGNIHDSYDRRHLELYNPCRLPDWCIKQMEVQCEWDKLMLHRFAGMFSSYYGFMDAVEQGGMVDLKNARFEFPESYQRAAHAILQTITDPAGGACGRFGDWVWDVSWLLYGMTARALAWEILTLHDDYRCYTWTNCREFIIGQLNFPRLPEAYLTPMDKIRQNIDDGREAYWRNLAAAYAKSTAGR